MTRGHKISNRAVKRALGRRPLPLGQGVIVRVLEIQEREQLRLALLLAGYDGLGSMHGDGERVAIVSTESQARELDEALASIARYGVRFRVVPER
jgi:hypothetical protein